MNDARVVGTTSMDATPPEEPQRLLRRVRGATFMTDVDGVVVAWSPEAALRLGHRPDQAHGVTCRELLDVREGTILERVARGEVPPPQVLSLRRSDGTRQPFTVACTVFATAVPGRPWVLFGLHEAPAREAPAREASAPRSSVRLSRRELEVLSLLARGTRGEHIAQELGIARATVRNHVQRLFRKLRVRSRLEAVALAYREGLVTARAP